MILYSSQGSILIRQQNIFYNVVLFITRGVRIVRKFNPNLNFGQFAIGIQESRAPFRFGFVSLWICGGILGGFGI